MTRLSSRRVTAEQFDAVRPYLSSLSEKRIEQARLAMVDGALLKDIADREGVSPNAISKLVRQVWETLERQNILTTESELEVLPPGWERVTLTAPKDFIERIRAELADRVRSL